jgi:hypothetical protein
MDKVDRLEAEIEKLRARVVELQEEVLSVRRVQNSAKANTSQL